ncbi:uncharacterized protein EDB93DRAFT_1248364 [Suillus bovinus]|uniref:uncharacterized protein n=1 Tax=Suillus bovinus TaxID=48563 RepID=UPI001B86A234|nr:uncharacterized protein EDB93DRAFT_1248364 [Suillus bovinus]KAG2154157.1 hypothetical protein EDB93DRAFT_1248364 [Suillus bovinus]
MKEIPPPMDDEDGADAEDKELEPGQILDEGIHQGEGGDSLMDDTNDVPLPSHTNKDQDWPDWDDPDNSSTGALRFWAMPSHTPHQYKPDDTSKPYNFPQLSRTPQDPQIMPSSDDSDASTRKIMKTLMLHSHKASSTHLPGHTSSDQDSDPLPSTSSRSVSRKWPRDATSEFNAKLNNASDSLMRHIQDSSTAKAKHKCLKIKSKLASMELRACVTRDEREHMLWSASAAQSHERAMADEQTKQLELEIKLEQVKLEHLALEKELSHQGN